MTPITTAIDYNAKNNAQMMINATQAALKCNAAISTSSKITLITRRVIFLNLWGIL